MTLLPDEIPEDPWAKLRSFTRARIGLDRCGDGMSTAALLQFQLDHAHARDAVKQLVDFDAVTAAIGSERVITVQSAAPDRAAYVRRPDLGRRLHGASRELLTTLHATEPWDVVFVIADGLSSAAVQQHAAFTLRACLRRLAGWRVAPIVLASQARVALGDEVALLLNADLCVVLIGERPGLSVANSLGIYLTWRPRVGHRDADRNCLSNVHGDGMTYEHAAEKVSWLLSEAKRRQLTGTALKEDAASTAALSRTPAPAQHGGSPSRVASSPALLQHAAMAYAFSKLAKAVCFLVTSDRHRARAFYSDTLGFKQIAEDAFASVFDLNGTMLRISTVAGFQAQGHTVLGWEVPDIAASVSALQAKGVVFTRYPGMPQNDLGIWVPPGSKTQVAWFSDPDGNNLSLTQF